VHPPKNTSNASYISCAQLFSLSSIESVQHLLSTGVVSLQSSFHFSSLYLFPNEPKVQKIKEQSNSTTFELIILTQDCFEASFLN
jgi:maleate cis-trans isomerase